MKTKSGDLCLMHMSAPEINAIFFIAYKSSTEVFVIAYMQDSISMWSETTEQFQEYEKYLKKI